MGVSPSPDRSISQATPAKAVELVDVLPHAPGKGRQVLVGRHIELDDGGGLGQPLGDPLDQATFMGPVAGRKQFDTMRELRSRYFGEEQARAMFGEEEATTRQLLDLARIEEADVILNACDPRLNPPIFQAAFEAG